MRVVDTGECKFLCKITAYSLSQTRANTSLRHSYASIQMVRRIVCHLFLSDDALGTTPALVVPLQKTLSPDVDTRYKSLTDSKVRHRIYK
jgi:hypothetical protein